MPRLTVLMIVAAMGCMVFTTGNACAEEKNPFQKAIEDRFNAMDANKDGKIDYDEYAAAYQKSIKASFDRRDQNGDGALTKDEFVSKMGQPGAKSTGNSFQQVIQKKQAVQKDEKAAGEEKAVQKDK